jgi:putative oxidoreductase
MPVSVTPLDLGLLALRLYGGGTMCVVHGWGKLTSFPSAGFPDPFGIGATPSHGLAVFAEVLCAVLVAAGAFTRLATVPLIVTMAVAGFYIHGGGPLAEEGARLHLPRDLCGAARHRPRQALGRRARPREAGLTPSGRGAYVAALVLLFAGCGPLTAGGGSTRVLVSE